MSKKGSYLRGEKWFALTNGKCTDKDKRKDINFYLSENKKLKKKTNDGENSKILQSNEG